MAPYSKSWQQSTERTSTGTARTWGGVLLVLAAIGLGLFIRYLWGETPAKTYHSALIFGGHGEPSDNRFALPDLDSDHEEDVWTKAWPTEVFQLVHRPIAEILDSTDISQRNLLKESTAEDTTIISIVGYGSSTHPDPKGDQKPWLFPDAFSRFSDQGKPEWVGAVGLDEVLKKIANVQGTKLVILDLARLAPDPLLGIDDDFLTAAEQEVKKLDDQNLWVISACSSGERSYQSRALKGSVLAGAIRKSLIELSKNKVRDLTLAEFFKTLRDNCQLISGGLQTPELIASSDGADAMKVTLGKLVKQESTDDGEDEQANDESDKGGSSSGDEAEADAGETGEELQYDLAQDPEASLALYAPKLYRRWRWEQTIRAEWDDRELPDVDDSTIKFAGLRRQADEENLAVWQHKSKNELVERWRNCKRALLNALYFARHYVQLGETLAPIAKGLPSREFGLIEDYHDTLREQLESLHSIVNQADNFEQFNELTESHAAICEVAEKLLRSCLQRLAKSVRIDEWSVPDEQVIAAIAKSPLLSVDDREEAVAELERLATTARKKEVDKWSGNLDDDREQGFLELSKSVRAQLDDLVTAAKAEQVGLGAWVCDERDFEPVDKIEQEPAQLPKITALDQKVPLFVEIELPQGEESKYFTRNGDQLDWSSDLQIGGYGVRDRVYMKVVPNGLNVKFPQNVNQRVEYKVNPQGNVNVNLVVSRSGSGDSAGPIGLVFYSSQSATTPIPVTCWTADEPKANELAEQSPPKQQRRIVEVADQLKIVPDFGTVPIVEVRRRTANGSVLAAECRAGCEEVIEGFPNRETQFQFALKSHSPRPNSYKAELSWRLLASSSSAPFATADAKDCSGAEPTRLTFIPFNGEGITEGAQVDGLILKVSEVAGSGKSWTYNFAFDVVKPTRYVKLTPTKNDEKDSFVISLDEDELPLDYQDPKIVVINGKTTLELPTKDNKKSDRIKPTRTNGDLFEFDIDGYPRAARYEAGRGKAMPFDKVALRLFKPMVELDKELLILNSKIVPFNAESLQFSLEVDSPTGCELLLEGQVVEDFKRDRVVTCPEAPKLAGGIIAVKLAVKDLEYRLPLEKLSEGPHRLITNIGNQQVEFTLDRTKPEIVQGQPRKDRMTQGALSKDFFVRIEESESGSGVEKIQYLPSDEEPTPESKGLLNPLEPQSGRLRVKTEDFKPPRELLWARAIDYAGNVGEWRRIVDLEVIKPKEPLKKTVGGAGASEKMPPPDPGPHEFVVELRFAASNDRTVPDAVVITPGKWTSIGGSQWICNAEPGDKAEVTASLSDPAYLVQQGVPLQGTATITATPEEKRGLEEPTTIKLQ